MQGITGEDYSSLPYLNLLLLHNQELPVKDYHLLPMALVPAGFQDAYHNEQNCAQKASDKQKNNSTHDAIIFTMLSKTSIPSDDICFFNEFRSTSLI